MCIVLFQMVTVSKSNYNKMSNVFVAPWKEFIAPPLATTREQILKEHKSEKNSRNSARCKLL